MADKPKTSATNEPEAKAAREDLPESHAAARAANDPEAQGSPAAEGDGERTASKPGPAASESSQDERTRLWRAACARWVLVAAATSVWLLNFLKPSPLVMGGWLGLLIIGLAFINALQMVCARVGMLISPSLVLAADIAAATGLLYVTGGGQGAFCIAYFFPIIVAIAFFGGRRILFAGFASAAVYGLYCLGDPRAPATPRWAGLAMCMALLGLWGFVLRAAFARLGGAAANKSDTERTARA